MATNLEDSSLSSSQLTNGSEAPNTTQAGVEALPGMGRREEWVKLNIGGTVFMTTKTTLCREKSSFLARLCEDDQELPSLKDDSGAYLIDRDPRYFPAVLNYLRHGKVIIDCGLSEEGVLEEAEFYNLSSLVTAIKDKMTKKAQRVFKDGSNSVYRVLHCHEGELTRTLATLTDGWKMSQLLNIGSQYTYSSEDQGEFLVIVSKDFDESPASPSEPTNKQRTLQQDGLRGR